MSKSEIPAEGEATLGVGATASVRGVHPDTVRRNIRRGAYPGAFRDEGGVWRIPVVTACTTDHGETTPEARQERLDSLAADLALLAELRGEVEYLRALVLVLVGATRSGTGTTASGGLAVQDEEGRS